MKWRRALYSGIASQYWLRPALTSWPSAYPLWTLHLSNPKPPYKPFLINIQKGATYLPNLFSLFLPSSWVYLFTPINFTPFLSHNFLNFIFQEQDKKESDFFFIRKGALFLSRMNGKTGEPCSPGNYNFVKVGKRKSFSDNFFLFLVEILIKNKAYLRL